MTKHGYIHYEEKTMKELRIALERIVLSWPETKVNIKLYVPHYSVREQVFAMLFTNRIVLRNLTEEQKQETFEKLKAEPFKTVTFEPSRNWIQIRFAQKTDIGVFLPYLILSYMNTKDML